MLQKTLLLENVHGFGTEQQGWQLSIELNQEYIRDKSVQPPIPAMLHPFSKMMQ